MRSYRLCILCPVVAAALALILSLFAPAPTRGQAPDPNKPVSFMDEIAPILKENCFACHGPKQPKGRFNMTTFEGLLKGGDKGEAVVPGKPEESFLWTLTSGTESPEMPPKEAGGMLPKEKVALIERWIKQGAKFDGPSPQADLVAELRKRWRPPTPPTAYTKPAVITALTFTPDGQKLVVGGHHELLVWDYAAGKLEKRIRTRAERARAMVFLPDGKTLVVAGGRPGQEGDVRLYNLDAPHPKNEGGVLVYDGVTAQGGVLVRELLQADDEVLCLALSKDGKKLAAGGCDRIVRVWSLDGSPKLEQAIENHADWVLGVAFSPDGTKLLTCSRDKTCKVWDLAAKESVLTFPGHQNTVYDVTIRPDGKIAVSCGEDNQLRFWNAFSDGKQIRSTGGHAKAVFKVVHHPTKPLLVTCSADGTVRVWNADNGQNVRTLSGHTDWVYAVAVSPDGKLVASGAYNGEVRVWTLDDGKPVTVFNASPGIPTAAKPTQ
jgi:WD40 repeat protein